MTLYEQVAGFIERFELLEPHQELVVAVSGGADSQCLLDCLVKLEYRPLVAHLDHALRPESHQEADAVATLAAQKGYQAVIRRLEQGELAGSHLSIEHAARLARYRFLVDVAVEHRMQIIATGHTADDQAETVLMHILRGTGSSGLRGMLPLTSLDHRSDLPGGHGIQLVRPLLGVTHEITLAHCEQIGLAFFEDESNLDLDLTRNRIRHELLPLLETYNPAIRGALIRLAEVMRADVAWQERQVDTLWTRLISWDSSESLELDLDLFADQPEALRRAILRRSLVMLLGDRVTLDLELTDRVLNFLSGPNSSRAMGLPESIRLERSAEYGRFFRPGAVLASGKYPQLGSNETRTLQIPSELDLLEGWRIRVGYEQLPATGRQAELLSGGSTRVLFDPVLGQEELEVRGRMPGDRIRLLGLAGSQKLSDLMINSKLPRRVRAQWPLVVNGDEILWVAGLAQAERTKVPEGAGQALVFELIAPGGEAPDRMDTGG